MSTCSSNCQNYSCANSEDFAQTKLTLILGVLDLFNGFLGVLVAILVGYLQARQFRRFNRAMDGSNDDEKASQQPLKPAATRPEPAKCNVPTLDLAMEECEVKEHQIATKS